MILKTLTITASPDLYPDRPQTFVWKDGDPLPDLIAASEALAAYIVRRQDQLATALASQQPIATP